MGGKTENPNRIYDELYQLSMVSLTWTEIQTGQLTPQCRTWCSLSAPTQCQLVLHGGKSMSSNQSLDDTWILDLPSLSWKKRTTSSAPSRHCHTGTAGMNGSVIIVGGEMYDQDGFAEQIGNISSLRLEPKGLQQLAIQKIYQHQNCTAWEQLLPNS